MERWLARRGRWVSRTRLQSCGSKLTSYTSPSCSMTRRRRRSFQDDIFVFQIRYFCRIRINWPGTIRSSKGFLQVLFFNVTHFECYAKKSPSSFVLQDTKECVPLPVPTILYSQIKIVLQICLYLYHQYRICSWDLQIRIEILNGSVSTRRGAGGIRSLTCRVGSRSPTRLNNVVF